MRIILFLLFVTPSISLIGQLDYQLHDQYRDEIKTLVDHPVIKSSFDYIIELEPETKADLITLTEIEAPPFKEEKRGAYFAQRLEQLGLDSVWIDAVGNVIGLIKGTVGDRTVCLDAHLDTVFPEGTDVTVHERGDTLYAPGIGDDTRGLAMLLTVTKTLLVKEIKLRDDLLIIASVGEEGQGDLRGVKELFSDRGPRIDSWISIDGGSLGRITQQALGSFRYRVSFKGPGGHSWGAFGLVNPHHALGDAINRFVERGDHFTSYGPRTSYNVGIVAGGTSVNSIPFESSMDVDMRSELHSRLDTMEQLLEVSVQEALDSQNNRKRRGADLTVNIRKIGDRPSGELSTDLPLIQRTIAATAAMGKRPKTSRGSTNSNIPISIGIPAVTIGRGGRARNAHALDEWWLNDEGHKAIQLAYLLVVAEAGLTK